MPAQIITAGAFNPISVELFDAYGNVAAATPSSTPITVQMLPQGQTRAVITGNPAGQDITLKSDSATGQFFLVPNSGVPVTTVTIPKGQSLATFYYQDTATVGITAHVAATAAKLGTGFQIEHLNIFAASQVAFLPVGTAVSPAVTFTAGVGATVNGQLEAIDNSPSASTAGGTLILTSSSATGSFTNFIFPGAVGVKVNGSATLTGPFSGPITIVVPAGVPFDQFSFTYTDTKAAAVQFSGSATFGPVALLNGTQQDRVVANPDLTKAHFAFTPTSGTATVNLPSNAFTIELDDQYNNPISAPAGGVTATLSSNSLGTYSFQAAGGANLASNQILIAPGSSTSAAFTYTDNTSSNGSTYTLKATNAANGIVGTASVAVAALPTQISLSTATLPTIVAGQKSGQVTVTLKDGLGNVVNAVHSTTITLTSTNSTTGKFQNVANLGSNVTTLTIAAGSSSATFTYSDTLVSTPILTVTDTTDGFAAKTVTTAVSAAAAAKLSFTTLTGGSVTTGTVVTVRFAYLDQYNNIATTPAGITVTATASGGVVSNMNAAAKTFDFQSATTGTFTIQLTSASPILTGTVNPFTISVRLPTGVNPPAFGNNEFTTPLYATLTAPNQVPSWTWNGVGQAGTTDAPFTNVSPDFPFSNWAFMTGGAAFSQTLDFTSIGVYTLAFYAEERSPAADLTVLLDNSVTNVSPAVTAGALISSSTPTLITVSVSITTVGNHTITFLSGQPNQNTTGTVMFSVVDFV